MFPMSILALAAPFLIHNPMAWIDDEIASLKIRKASAADPHKRFHKELTAMLRTMHYHKKSRAYKKWNKVRLRNHVDWWQLP